MSWRPSTQPARARVLLCTWDRQGLAAKAAAAFCAAGLNILQASVFTRADNVVLDEFSVIQIGEGGANLKARMREMALHLEGALSEPPRVPAPSTHGLPQSQAGAKPAPLRIVFEPDKNAEAIAVQIMAADRPGLLHDLLQAITNAGLDIHQARIETEGELARDTIHVHDGPERRPIEQSRLDDLRARLEVAITTGH